MKFLLHTGSRPASKFLDLEQMVVTYPQLCDSDYKVDMEKDWVGIDKKFKPVALPWVRMLDVSKKIVYS